MMLLAKAQAFKATMPAEELFLPDFTSNLGALDESLITKKGINCPGILLY